MLRGRHLLGTKPQVVQRHADNAAQHDEIPDPLCRPLPETHHPRNVRIFRQPAISFGIGGVVEHIDDGSTHARRIIDTGLFEAEVLAKLGCASLLQIFHVLLGSKMQTASRT